MRKAYLTAAIMLLSCAWVAAQNRPAADSSQPSQQYPSTQQPDKSQTSTSGQEHAAHSVEGCLGGAAGSYTLTDASGKTYQLTGDTSKLAEHVGHTVQVSGTEDTSAATGAGAPAALNVKKVKMVSPSCPTK